MLDRVVASLRRIARVGVDRALMSDRGQREEAAPTAGSLMPRVPGLET